MPVRTYQTLCTSKRIVAPHVYELTLQKPHGFLFQAGQFVLFDVPLLENPKDVQPRAYSIASAPQETDLLFVLKLVAGGRASLWIEKDVSVGTPVSLQGPFGKFILDRKTPEPYLFIATGSGIAPFRSQLEWALKVERDTRPMDLLFGVLKKEDLFWGEWMRGLEQQYPNFHAHVSYLSGESDWHGQSGSIQERFPAILRERGQPGIYICGAPEMVKEVKEQCVALGIPKGDVHTEAYI